jgi:5-methylcytosine-specific restriction endonuclease McrA
MLSWAVWVVKAWAAAFYGSEAWHVCRGAFLQSKGNLCERCAAAGKVEAAKIAHHKKHLTPRNIDDPWACFSWDNLEALCQSCHNSEHHAERKEKRYGFDDDGNIFDASPLSEK